jgi:methanogenic corrinoid protein MtbC1
MNEQGELTATLLDASRKAFAAGAILRLQESGAEGQALVESWGFNRLVEDMQIRVHHLAESLACGRLELFRQDVSWLGAAFAGREVPREMLTHALSCLQAELKDSLPSELVETACYHVQAGLDVLSMPASKPDSLLKEGNSHVELAREFLLALIEGRRNDALAAVLDAHQAGVPVNDLHLHVIQVAQNEIGAMWQAGDATVAEEHLSSRIVEEVLFALRERMPQADAIKRCMLAASVPGNLHDIGARMVGDHFEMHGWSVHFLGANVPAADIANAAAERQVDLVALSAGLALQVRATRDAIQAVRASSPDLPILVGGRPYVIVPDLWKDVGADGFAADPVQAVEVGTRITS